MRRNLVPPKSVHIPLFFDLDRFVLVSGSIGLAGSGYVGFVFSIGYWFPDGVVWRCVLCHLHIAFYFLHWFGYLSCHPLATHLPREALEFHDFFLVVVVVFTKTHALLHNSFW
jgi:hypothetical protein